MALTPLTLELTQGNVWDQLGAQAVVPVTIKDISTAKTENGSDPFNLTPFNFL